jgi:hypothetical protein
MTYFELGLNFDLPLVETGEFAVGGVFQLVDHSGREQVVGAALWLRVHHGFQ